MNNMTSKFILSFFSFILLINYTFAAVHNKKAEQCLENDAKLVIFRARAGISDQLSVAYNDYNQCQDCLSINSCNAKIALLKNASWRLNSLIGQLAKATKKNHQEKLCSSINRLVELVQEKLENFNN